MNPFLVLLLATSVIAEARPGGGAGPVKVSESNATHSSSQFDVVTAIKGALNEELLTTTHPKLIGAAALIFGFCFWLHGGKSLDICVVVILAVVVGILAKQSVLQYWEDKDNHLAYIKTEHGRHMAANFVAVEAGLVTAAAVFKGHTGVMVGVGAAAGFLFSSMISNLMVQHVSPQFATAEVQVVWHSLVVFSVAWAVWKGKHVHFLVYLAPMAGSVFISSALMYFATDAVAAKCRSELNCSPPHPKTGEWVDFFKMVFSPLVSKTSDADFGLFHDAGKDFHMGKEGEVIYLDHIILLVMWAFFALVGYSLQKKIVAATAKAQERPDLSEALLQRL